MRPAQQGFDADHAPVDERNLRLVVQFELVHFERAAQGVFELQRAVGALLHLAREETEGIAPALFGAVHRGVGAHRQRVVVVAVARIQGDTERGRDVQLVVFDVVWRGERLQHLFSHMRRPLGAGAGQDENELVAAEPGDRILVAQDMAQAPGDLDQQFVADAVTERVIDVLETIDVHEDQRQRFGVAFDAAQCLADAIGQQAAVGQAGQRVEMRQPVNVRLVRLVRRDVGDDRDVVADLAVFVVHAADRRELGIQVAVLAPVPEFAVPGTVHPDAFPHGTHERCIVATGVHHGRRLADQFRGGVARHLHVGLVHHEDVVRGIEDDDAFGALFEDGGGQAQLLGRLQALGEVGQDAVRAQEVAAPVARDLPVDHQQPARAIPVQKMEVQAIDFSLLLELRKLVLQGLDRSIGHEVTDEAPDHFLAPETEKIQPGVVDFEDVALDVERLISQRRLLVQLAETAFALAQRALHRPPFLLTCEQRQREADVLRHLDQQNLYRLIEGVGLAGIEDEGADHFAVARQWQRRRRAPARAFGALVPRLERRLGEEVLHPVRLALTQSNAGRPAPLGLVRIDGNLQLAQQAKIIAKAERWPHEQRLPIEPTDPGGLHAAVEHGDTTDLRKKLFRAMRADDRLVALADRGMGRRQPLCLCFRLLALGDVLHRCKNVLELSVGSAHAAHVHRHEDDRAILADEALVQRVGLDRAIHQLLELREIRCQIVRMRHVHPRPGQQLRARITEYLAQAIVAAQPVPGRRRADRDPDERQVVELPEHLVRLRPQLELHGTLALAPEQKDHCTDHHQRDQRDQADPE